jgi:hypothetical protein
LFLFLLLFSRSRSLLLLLFFVHIVSRVFHVDAQKRRKMRFSLNVQLNGSAISLLVSRDEPTLDPSLAKHHEQI